MKLRAALLPLALLGASAGLAPEAALAAPTAKEEAAHKTACDELAAAIVTGDDAGYQVDAMIAALMTALVDGNPDFASMEQAFPGMKDAIGVEVKPVLLAHIMGLIPAYRSELSQLYQANLTTQDALAAAAFFRQPEVRAFVSNINRSADYSAMSNEAVAREEVSGRSVRSDLGKAGIRATRDLSPEQCGPIMAFFASPLGAKFLALGTQKTAIDVKWSNYTTPRLEADIMQAVGRGMVDHIAKTQPDLAKAMETEFIRSGMIEP